MIAESRSRVRFWFCLAFVAIAMCGGCELSGNRPDEVGAASQQGIWLRDETQQSGLTFQHHSGHETLHIFPEIMGGGVALLDMDNDGDLDAYFVQSGSLKKPGPSGANKLYRNDGSGRFQEIADSGAEDEGYGMGVAAADFDNDGDVDLFVTNVGANVLLQNDGTGHFTDISAAAYIAGDKWSTSSAFGDFDRDGDLDLFVCNYVHWTLDEDLRCNNGAGQEDYCSPLSYSAPEPDVLYDNNGDGTFTDISIAAGLRSAFGNGLGVVCGDFNGDGNTDIFVSNDGTDNQYWSNQGDGTFVDQALLTGCAVDNSGKANAGMGTCAADVDHDDDLDLLVVNLQAQSDSFFRNEGRFFFDDTPRVGLGTSTRSNTRMGVGWIDFNNDGEFDLFQANGRVTMPSQMADDTDDPFAQPNVLLEGNGFDFRVVDPSLYPQTSRASHGAAFGDLDDDGGVDIVVVNRDSEAEVLMNRFQPAGNWLLVRAINTLGRDDTGAVLRFEIRGRSIRRDVNPHYSFLASNDPRVHLGMGSAEKVDGITVAWVNGAVERFAAQAANQTIALRQGEGTQQ